MLDKFATLYKKKCNNQFVVAQRKPLGCVQAGCVSPCSLTQPGVPIKTRHQLMHNVGCGWKVCWLQQPLWKVINLCPISRFCPKIGSFKILNWLVTWLLIFFSLLPLLFASVLKETAQSQRSLPDCGFLCDSHYTTHLLLSNCRTQNPFVFGLQSKPCYCR